MKLTHPSGRPLTADEEKMVVDKLPHPGMIMRRTPEQWDALILATIQRLFGEPVPTWEHLETLAEALSVAMKKAIADINAIERRIRAAEWIEVKEKEG